MNEHDSEKICGMLESVGFKKIDDIEKSDIVILNTCFLLKSPHITGQQLLLSSLFSQCQHNREG
mgnify:CR=1 FL=1